MLVPYQRSFSTSLSILSLKSVGSFFVDLLNVVAFTVGGGLVFGPCFVVQCVVILFLVMRSSR